jgi:hypothetical protein
MAWRYAGIEQRVPEGQLTAYDEARDGAAFSAVFGVGDE